MKTLQQIKAARFKRAAFGEGGIFPWDSIISGGASIIGASIGANASKYAANKYLEGVENTNEANLKLAREQQAWDLAQWQRENEYNSAASQMQRWQEAGMSPNSFAGVGSPGEAASLQSPTLANQVAPGDLSGYAQGFSSSINQGVQGAISAALDWRQIHLREKQLEYDKQRLANETAGTNSTISFNQALTKQALRNANYLFHLGELTEEEIYKVRADTERTWQIWQQSANLFPHQLSNEEYSAGLKKLDYLLEDRALRWRLYRIQNEANLSFQEVKKKIQEVIELQWKNKEGEFTYDTQGLRWKILRKQGDRLEFDLEFDRDFKYSSMMYQRWIDGLRLGNEFLQTGIKAASEVREWLRPGNWLGNTDTWFDYNDKGRVQHVGRSFTPYPRE